MAYTLTLEEKADWRNKLANLAQAGSLITILPISSNYAVSTNDYRKMLSCTGTISVTLPNAATVTNGFHVFIKNNGSGTITVQTAIPSQRIDSENVRAIYPNEALMVIGNSAQYYSFHAGSFIIP